ncbi:MAG: hypothetical protein ABGY75_07360 [Gemmataceae bacterium]
MFTSPTPLARIPSPASPSSESDPFARIASDLKLVVDQPGPRRVYPGHRLRLSGTLVNLSHTRSYPVVRPGDGSYDGRGEPYTFMTATLTRPGGEAIDLKRVQVGKCGIYDTQWALRVETLRPGESIPIRGVIGFPLDEEGTVVARLFYRYTARPSDLFVTSLSHPTGRGVTHGRMAGVPPFEVVSDPVRVEVVRPHSLKLDLKKAEPRVGEKFVPSELITATLTQTGEDPFGGPVFGPHSLNILCMSFERRTTLDGGRGAGATPFQDYVSARLPVRHMKVGESVELFSLLDGDSDLLRQWRHAWTARTPGSLTVRVWCYGEEMGLVNADPIELTIAP